MSDDRAELEAKLKQMQEEMARLQAQLEGTGSIAQGEQARAAHAESGGIAIAGDIKGNAYFGPAPQDESEALQIYRRVLRQTTGHLPLRGVDIEASDPTASRQPLKLVNVYIDLETVGQLYAGKVRRRDRAKQEFWVETERSSTAMEAVINSRQLVLLGDPGSGKSTFVNHLATCLASHSMEPEQGWLDHLAGWPENEANILPLLVILRDFAQSLPSPLPHTMGPNQLWQFMTVRLKAQNLHFAIAPIEKQLDQGNALILLDGLDEVPSARQRAFVQDAVWAFMQRYPDNRYLVTCRTLSYQPPATPDASDLRLPERIPTAELAPFDENRIDRFVEAWYSELVQQGTIRSEDQATLAAQLQQAVRRPDIWRLAANPLLLTVIALVHTHKGRLPDARALLYEETVDLLLWRWEQVKVGRERETAQLRQLLLAAERTEMDLKKLLWQLAFEAQARGSADDDNTGLAGIGQWPLQKALAGLKENDHNWAQQVIRTIKLRAGLLLEREPEIFTFPHRTFQEYLAGAHLTTQADFARQATRLAAEGALWREVILLAVGRLVYLAGDTDKPLFLVSELCPARPRESDEISWRKVWLAGEVMLEIGLKRANDSITGQELLGRVQQRLVTLITEGHLTPRERAEAGDVLVKLGDPRPEVTTVDGMQFCYVPSGPFMMGSPDDDNMAFDREKTLHQFEIEHNYWLARYPVTVAQWREFVESSDHQPTDADSLRDPLNRPVPYVTWHEAVMFCDWLTKKWQGEEKLPAKWQVRLPSEAEWEKAARGGLEILEGPVMGTLAELDLAGLLNLPGLITNPQPQRRFPWGDEPDPNKANYGDTGIGTTSAVGCFPRGKSSCGVEEMSGNVYEWCLTKWQDSYENYQNDNDPEGNAARVVRGGAFHLFGRYVRCAFRFGYYPYYGHDDRGFRVVLSPFASGL